VKFGTMMQFDPVTILTVKILTF